MTDSYLATDGARLAPGGWTSRWHHGIEYFTDRTGRVYVRAAAAEVPDLEVPVRATRRTLRLKLADVSATVRRQQRKARREQRELRKRGYGE